MRIKRFVNCQKNLGFSTDSIECDDAKTSMSEIVKRFFNNEPIPQYQQNEVYDYNDETIGHEIKHYDEKGNPLKDKSGNIITEEVLNREIIDIIPIHPNAEDIDPHGDNDSLGRLYGEANEKLGAFQRVEAQKKLDSKARSDAKAIEIAKKNGYVKQTDDVKLEDKR